MLAKFYNSRLHEALGLYIDGPKFVSWLQAQYTIPLHHPHPTLLYKHPPTISAFMDAITPVFSSHFIKELEENVRSFRAITGDCGKLADEFIGHWTTIEWIERIVDEVEVAVKKYMERESTHHNGPSEPR